MKYADKNKQPTVSERRGRITEGTRRAEPLQASEGGGAEARAQADAERSVIPLRSLTGSIKAQKLLRELGIEARVVKPGSAYSGGGCGYGISVSRHSYDAAVKALGDAGIAPLRIGR